MYRNIFYSFDSQIKVYVISTGMCVTECVVNIYKINDSIYDSAEHNITRTIL